MQNKISDSVRYIGVFDTESDLFEGQYKIPEGISYNSYVIFDEKITVMDTVDISFTDEWLEKLADTLSGKEPHYIVVHHMEPDHSASLKRFSEIYKNTVIVASLAAFAMMKNFYGIDFSDRRIIAKEGETLDLGKPKLTFIAAPMVHWPEVIFSYDSFEKILFSADAFGKFGSTDSENQWDEEAARYYFGIVGKYGAQVSRLLERLSSIEIKTICSLHGPVLKENIGYHLSLYKDWSSYKPDKQGVVIAYASVYGNTKKAAQILAERLKKNGEDNIKLFDLARCDIHEAVSNAFRYDRLVLASITYNASVFPPMKSFIDALCERGFNGRRVALIENGSWAPQSAKVMKNLLNNCENIDIIGSTRILSAPNEATAGELKELAKKITT